MTKFYTFVGSKTSRNSGQEIFHRWIENGKRYSEITNSFPIDLFVKAEYGNDRDIYGNKLKKYTFQTTNDASDFIERKKKENIDIYGQTNFIYQFISYNYPEKIEFDISQLVIANLDIETESNNGFPIPSLADQKITAITIKQFGEKYNYTTFGLKPHNKKTNDIYIHCKNEHELIVSFFNYWEELNPDIITGYNIEGFDIPYIINRSRKIVNKKIANRFSPFSEQIANPLKEIDIGFGNSSYEIFGIVTLDYQQLYKKFSPKKPENIKLDTVSEFELGENKIEFDEYIDGKTFQLLTDSKCVKIPDGKDTKSMPEFVRYCALRKKIQNIIPTGLPTFPVDYLVDINNIDELENIDLSELSTDELFSLYNKTDYIADLKCFEIGILYNKTDVKLVEKLDNKLNFMSVALTMTYMAKVVHKDIFGQVRFWDTFLYNFALSKNLQIPPQKNVESDGIEGAYVKEPKPGKYKNVVSFDLNSLYPSIIMQYNMGPETLVKKATGNYIDKLLNKEIDTQFLIDKNLTMTANGALFRKDKWSLMAELVTSLYAERKSVKNNMLNVESENELLKAEIKNRKNKIVNNYQDKSNKELQELFDHNLNIIASANAYQLALKISLNSLYGGTANEGFRYFSTDIAEGITLTGQYTIKFISDKINQFLNKKFKTNNIDYVIANDTDSAYIYLGEHIEEKLPENMSKDKIITFIDKFCSKIIEPFLDESFDELANYLNAYTNAMKMKRESIADWGAWRAKKNYILQVWDNEGVRYEKPKLKAVGVETARTSTPKFIKPYLLEFYKLFLNEDEETVQTYIKTVKTKFDDLSNEQISFPRGMNDLDKWLDDSGEHWKTGTPIHVKASICYNNMLKKHNLDKDIEPIRNGDKVKFIYLKVPNPTFNNAIAFHENILPEFDLEKYIDRELQFEKSFLNPVISFLELVDWKVEKQNTLYDLFN